MTRKTVAASLIAVGLLAGTAGPALAADSQGAGSYVCLMATHDKYNPGQPTFCVWVPVDRANPS